MWETFETQSRKLVLERVRDAETVHSPGTTWHYSNLAYALLGEVIGVRRAQRGAARVAVSAPYDAYEF